MAGGYGDYKTGELEGMVNVPLSDTFALRLSGKGVRQDEGFFFNRKPTSTSGAARWVWAGCRRAGRPVTISMSC